jgi:hypothetical protein
VAALLPQYRGEPSQPSESRVAYDETAIYVFRRMYADPWSVRTNTVYRDAYASDDRMCSAVVSVSAAGGEHHTGLSDCLPDVGEDSAHR